MSNFKTQELQDGDMVSLGRGGRPPFARYDAKSNAFVVDVASLARSADTVGFLHVTYKDVNGNSIDFTDDGCGAAVMINNGRPHVVTRWDDKEAADHVIERRDGKVFMIEQETE